MDNTEKYLYLKHEGKNAYESVNEITSAGKSPLYAVKKIKEIFPFLSLTEAKEIVVIATSEHKSIYDHEEGLCYDLDKLNRQMNEESGHHNLTD